MQCKGRKKSTLKVLQFFWNSPVILGGKKSIYDLAEDKVSNTR